LPSTMRWAVLDRGRLAACSIRRSFIGLAVDCALLTLAKPTPLAITAAWQEDYILAIWPTAKTSRGRGLLQQ
jgi:hypothetical protein